MNKECSAAMVLQSMDVLSSVDVFSLYSAFGSFSGALSADADTLATVLGGKTLHEVLRYQQRRDELDEKAARICGWSQENNVRILTLSDDNYPALLKQISRPPPLLFVKGDPLILNLPQIAVVGSRNASASGLNNAREFSRLLAASGFAITSGMAQGIDGAAHQGAIESGKTIAVIGTGIDVCYPRRHQHLAGQIVEQGGAIVSEFYPGTPPLRQNFPRRNRIISGLSAGVLVVEAALKSGSLITARLAMEENREVFAIPSSIHNALGKGCHQLIKQGAILVETAADIAEHLGALLSYMHTETGNGETPAIDKGWQTVLDAMGFDPVDIDALVTKTALSVAQLNQQLLEMELAGVVESRAGNFVRVC